MICLPEVYNNIWMSNKFPHTWRQMVVVPIPKNGKDSTNPDNNCPIALTSCLCKTMERMIGNGLRWFLESNRLITNPQPEFHEKL